MKKSLLNDTFTIDYYKFGGSVESIKFKGNLMDAMRLVFQKYDGGVASFYTSDGYWLKEIML